MREIAGSIHEKSQCMLLPGSSLNCSSGSYGQYGAVARGCSCRIRQLRCFCLETGIYFHPTIRHVISCLRRLLLRQGMDIYAVWRQTECRIHGVNLSIAQSLILHLVCR